jgi:hypothetical protein
VCMQREDVGGMLCRPERAKALGVRPFVCLPLMGGTKNDTTAPCGIVVCWETASALRVGDHVEALLEMYKTAGQETGALLTHGADATAWTRNFALHRVLRPALRRLQELGAGIGARAVVSEYISNTFRRGGNTRALGRGGGHTPAMHRARPVGIEVGTQGWVSDGRPVRRDRHRPEACRHREDGVNKTGRTRHRQGWRRKTPEVVLGVRKRRKGGGVDEGYE